MRRRDYQIGGNIKLFITMEVIMQEKEENR